MSLFSLAFCVSAARTDARRDAGLAVPPGLTVCRDIPYREHASRWELLDVYWPAAPHKPLPVIVSVHGGGYVYGTKEVYQYYCMSLAERGFAVINFNYRLAPGARFPAQLAALNRVLGWMAQNKDIFPFDTDNVFLVGDSAGAQMASHYAALWSNPDYAALYPFTVAGGFALRALALNCGMYDLAGAALGPDIDFHGNLYDDYIGKDRRSRPGIYPLLDVLGHIDGRYPPAFVMTSCYDFLRDNAEPMADLLRSRGVEAEYRLYGKEGDTHMGHVFHCNMRLPEAAVCNEEECAFFRRHIAGQKTAGASCQTGGALL